MDYRVPDIYGKIRTRKACVSVPGSKSMTARAYLMASLADGTSRLKGAQSSDDCGTFLRCVEEMGVRAERDGDDVLIHGMGGAPKKDRASLYVGNAGTAARFLTALTAFSDGEYTLDCAPQMKVRPMKPLISALERAGAVFTFAGERYRFPFTVRGTSRPSGEITVDISESSQFLSALLMCAPVASVPVTVKAEGLHGMGYVAMTTEMMRSFGVDVGENGGIFRIRGKYCAREYGIEPDVSAACYFAAMNRILGTEISVNGLKRDTLQSDGRFMRMIGDFDGGDIDMSAFSDQALTLAAVAPFFGRPTHITGIGHIRRQECDRIRAICVNLAAMGIDTEEHADGVTVYPGTPHGCEIDPFGDHRVAMSFAVTGMRTPGTVIKDASAVSKTFPEFFGILDALAGTLVS